MKVRIGNDICLYVNLLGNKNLDAVNINSVEAYLINVSKWHDIMDESFRESALMQDEINCRKDKIKFVSRFPVEPHFPGFHPTPYDVCCTGHPCYHQHPIPYIPMYHGYGVHPHTFERGCFGPCAWHTNHPHHLHFPHGHHHHFDNCHCCEPHTWDCDDMCDVYERAGIKHLDMQRQLDRCRFLAPVESTASKNKIKVYFPANAQLYTGTYKLVIVAKIHEPGFCENNLRVVTIDYENVFTLVNHCEDGLDGDIIIRVGTNKFDPSDIKAVRPYAEGYTIYEGDQLALNDIDVNGKQYKLLIDLVDGRTIEYDPDEWEFGAINFDNNKKNVITVSENFGTIITMADSAGKDDVVLVYDNTHTQLTSYTVNVIEREPEHLPKLVEAISSINGPDRVKIGSSTTYTVTFDPSDADTGTGLTWEVVSGDATIDQNGRLTVGGEGTVVIRVTSENGKSKEKTITVYDDTPVTPTEIEPSSVSISGVSRMDERTTTTFSAVVNPSNANTNTSVQWSVIGVGSISQNGVYTAPSVDSDTQVKIVAVTGNGKRDEKIITVVDTDTPVVNPDYSFEITDYPQQVKVGANNMCRVTYNDPVTDDYSGFVWTWTPSDAITTSGDATGRTFVFTAAKAYDDVTVTATLGSDSDSITFTTYTDEEPENPPVSENWELVILGEDRSIPVGSSIQLSAVILDSISGNTKTETIEWSTSDTNTTELTPNGASVTVTGKDISPETTTTATITATSQSGLTGSVTVSVYQETQNPLEIRLEGVWYMNKDDEQTVTAIVLPLAADKRVTWSSSDDSIATVSAIDDSHAKVAAVNKGTVTITATSVVDNSVKGTMDIEITHPNDVRVTSITIDPITVEKGAYVDVRPYIHMTQANGERNTEYVNCTYTPTNSSFISISREGDLVGLEVTDGTTFTVTYDDGITTPMSQTGTVVVTSGYVPPVIDPEDQNNYSLVVEPYFPNNQQTAAWGYNGSNELQLIQRTSGQLNAYIVNQNDNSKTPIDATWSSSLQDVRIHSGGTVDDAANTGNGTFTLFGSDMIEPQADSVTITATTSDYGSVSTVVKLKRADSEPHPTTSIVADNMALNVGESRSVNISSWRPNMVDDGIQAYNGTYGNITIPTFVSGNTSIFTVNQDGVVTGVAEGSAILTVKTYHKQTTFNLQNQTTNHVIEEWVEGPHAECTVTVSQPHTYTIAVNPTSMTLNVGQTFDNKITAVCKIDNQQVTDANITWNSSNPSVATVSNNGTVTSVSGGSTVVTATWSSPEGNKTASCNVTVPNAYTITWNVGDHAHVQNISSESALVNGGYVNEGQYFSMGVVANQGYDLNTTTVTMGGTDVTAQCVQRQEGEDPTTFTPVIVDAIHIQNVTGNVVITTTTNEVAPPAQQYTVTYTINGESGHMTVNNPTTQSGGTVEEGSAWTAEFVADDGYFITAKSAMMENYPLNGTPQTVDVEGTFGSMSNNASRFVINITNVTGNVNISVTVMKRPMYVTYKTNMPDAVYVNYGAAGEVPDDHRLTFEDFQTPSSLITVDGVHNTLIAEGGDEASKFFTADGYKISDISVIWEGSSPEFTDPENHSQFADPVTTWGPSENIPSYNGAFQAEGVRSSGVVTITVIESND